MYLLVRLKRVLIHPLKLILLLFGKWLRGFEGDRGQSAHVTGAELLRASG